MLGIVVSLRPLVFFAWPSSETQVQALCSDIFPLPALDCLKQPIIGFTGYSFLSSFRFLLGFFFGLVVLDLVAARFPRLDRLPPALRQRIQRISCYSLYTSNKLIGWHIRGPPTHFNLPTASLGACRSTESHLFALYLLFRRHRVRHSLHRRVQRSLDTKKALIRTSVFSSP
jgi:hypothetical protein